MVGFAKILAVCALAIGTCSGSATLDKGVRMGSLATYWACWYEYDGKLTDLTVTPEHDVANCQGNTNLTEFQRQFIAQGADDSLQKSGLGQYIPGLIQQWLPAPYSDCNSYLTNSKKPPPTDMSRILQDDSGPYPFKGFAHCILGKVKETYGEGAISAIVKRMKCESSGVSDCSGGDAGSLDTGTNMATLATHLACWYEYAKRLPDYPDTRENSFGACRGNTDFGYFRKQFIDQNANEELQKISLAKTMPHFIHTQLPKATKYTDCENFLDNPNLPPPTDMSSVLKDGAEPYPFKGFAHCLLGKTKDRYGMDAVSAMAERAQYKDSNAPVPEIMVGRDNEYRSRHGAPPLKLDAELNKRAQKWADMLANECGDLHHIPLDNPDDMYKGDNMGENLGRFGVMDHADIALLSSNSWYSEVKDYPFPKGQGLDWEKVGHFTAQVWKSSKLAGYGLGTREGCDRVYTVARYWPAGNISNAPELVAKNVGPITPSG